MNSFVLSAAAKLNLSLRILARRDNGFHEIDTIMVKLPGLADELEFSESHGFAFTCDHEEIPVDGENLVVKATKAFESAAEITCTCAIFLKKKIPHGAGLGGGSSDAAAALIGLNRWHGEPLSASQLHGIAASLGSDIPFFLFEGAARCTGRGEIIEPVAAPPPLPVLLLKPMFNVATPEAYRRWNDSLEIPGIRYSPQDIGELEFVNDLERPVFEKYRFLAEVKHWLVDRREVRSALMSGSGSTVFAVLHDPADAEPLASAARRELDPGFWHWAGTTGI